jgi:hypothetical protein
MTKKKSAEAVKKAKNEAPTLEDRNETATPEKSSQDPDRISSPPVTTKTERNGTSDTKETTKDKPKVTPEEDKVKSPPKRSLLGLVLRSAFLDLPFVALFTAYVALLILNYSWSEYYMPQAQLMKWTNERKTPDLTYYNRVCTVQDVSTNSTADLVISPNTTPEEAMLHMAKHGVSLYPNILQEDTANELRDYIVQRNKVEEQFFVIAQENRFTFGIGVNQDPTVSRALKEIANHPVFRPAIEQIAGPNPAVIEFTAITSTYGAKDQWWHQDTLPMGSSFKHARTFLPSYSLFIPLQDTSSRIGATQICPGSHVCDGRDEMCQQGGFRVSGLQDKWEKGAGALVNQHLHHRGMAHTDPDGLDRVLFILTFSPRPRFNKNEVETRLFSMGGSYSLNWRQWGHAINDFGDAPVKMRDPWKTLRSLGLYKPRDADWGWDMISTASMRITNDDNGYHDFNLDEFIEEGGFRFLPKWLDAKLEEKEGWFDYIYKTMLNVKEAVETCYLIALAGYLILFLNINIIQSFMKKGNGSCFLRAIGRLLVLHGCVALLGGYTIVHISRTPWAQSIQHGKAYRLLVASQLPETMSPGTLPFRTDVLVETKYDSEYLYGYNYILEIAHPGNREFKGMLVNYSAGYATLPPSVKRELCLDVVNWVGQGGGRFLTQNEEGNWSEMSNDKAAQVVHKGLMKYANPIVGKVVTEIAYLQSETKFGVFRDMAIHRQHISGMLHNLQDKILDPPFGTVQKSRVVTKSSPSSRVGRALRRSLPKPRRDSSDSHLRLPSLPPVPAIQEPFQGAWLSEGDVVEGKYKCKHNGTFRLLRKIGFSCLCSN